MILWNIVLPLLLKKQHLPKIVITIICELIEQKAKLRALDK